MGIISGTPTSAGSYTFTVTASDASTPVQSANQQLTIVINNAPLAINTNSLPGGVISTLYTQPLQASSGTPPYTWTVASGSSLPAWLSISGSGTSWTLSGTPTAVGTSNFSLVVTDSTNPTHLSLTQPLSVTINATACGTGNETILNGQYAFSLSGFNATGFLAEIGSFTADGTGKITAGTVDSNGALGVQSAAITTSGSSYSVGSDNRGCATIVTPFYTFTTRFALGTVVSSKATEGRIIEWEPATSSAYIATGRILKQTVPANLPSGSYTYQYSGIYGTSAYRTGVVGMVTATAGSSGGTFANGEYDINVDGVLNDGNGYSTPYSGVIGTYTLPDPTTGRYTTQTWLAALPAIKINHAAYLVSGSQYLEMNTDALSSTTSVLVGQGQSQTGTLSNSSVSGNMVLYMTGLNGGGSGGQATIGLVDADGTSSLTAIIYEDDAGTWQTPSPNTSTCTYSVASNGRMTLSGSGCGSKFPLFYLAAANTAFMLTTDSGVGIGQVEPQVGTNFTVASVSGNLYMGTLELVNQAGQVGVGVIALDGSGDLNVTNDYTSTTSQNGDEPSSGTLTVNANGTLMSSDHPTLVGGIVISSTKVVIVDNQGSTYPSIQVVKK